MEKSLQRKICIAALAITVSLAGIIIACGFVARDQKNSHEKWVLLSYGNNVALYNGNEIIEVYGNIVLDTLPAEDKRLLDNGIVFQTRDEAVSAIEDFDG
ncbi:MAG: hypothetical protein IKD04_05710 [Clostridia bacterium]|nr:hypothetical protein [Clostridia bacterium]